MKKIVMLLIVLLSAVGAVACTSTKEYTVTFNSNGGSAVVSQTIEENGLVEEPNDPTNEGFTFVFWYLDSDSEAYDFTTPVTSDITLTAKWEEVTNPVVGRQHADYYVPGTPLIEDTTVVYINFDGFAKYYLDDMFADDTYESTLESLMAEGVYFENLRTTLPSITNPLQNAILSGSTSAITHNVYRYWNRSANEVIQQQRENDAPRLTELAVDAGIKSASVAHYLAGEDGFNPTNMDALYINVDNTTPEVVARGSAKNGDYFARFEQAIKLIKGEPIKTYSAGQPVTVTELPKFILIYADDLDAIGHNESGHYGYTVATSEIQRRNNAVAQLKLMDAKIGEFIQAAKDAGKYDNMTFFLTTDHGMHGFGAEEKGVQSPYTYTKYGALKTALRSIDQTYNVEFLSAGASASASSSIVAVGVNLNIQLTWKKDISDAELLFVEQQLMKLDYVQDVMTRKELEALGYWTYAADMIVVPSERYNFSSSILGAYSVRAQHDSLHDDANRIPGFVWGKGIKKNVIYDGEAYNYDFGMLMAASMGLQFPNANGIVLDIFESEE